MEIASTASDGIHSKLDEHLLHLIQSWLGGLSLAVVADAFPNPYFSRQRSTTLIAKPGNILNTGGPDSTVDFPSSVHNGCHASDYGHNDSSE
jgi:hypothetical protein